MDGELVDGHLKKQKYKGRNGFEVFKKKIPLPKRNRAENIIKEKPVSVFFLNMNI